jgi:uncharacterized protein YdhG (YjbR/CyaY superfamily)
MKTSNDVERYISTVPPLARPHFDTLRGIVTALAPTANEVVSYGIVGYKVDDKRARVFISGWRDHVAIYPVPRDESLLADLQPYIKGKGTLWFSLDQPLPTSLITQVVKALVQ